MKMKRTWKHWTPEEDAIIREHYPISAASGLVDRLPGRTKATILSRAYKLGVKYAPWSRPRNGGPLCKIIVHMPPALVDALTEAAGEFCRAGYVRRVLAEHVGRPDLAGQLARRGKGAHMQEKMKRKKKT